MKVALMAICCVSSSSLWATAAEPSPSSKLSAISLLPNGSQLHDVVFPRYDESMRLISSLKAGEMTLVNAEEISGTSVNLKLYNSDESLRAESFFSKARFLRRLNMVLADQTVTIRSDRFTTTGAGFCYSIESGEGYLLGPVLAYLYQKPIETSMKSSKTSMAQSAALLSAAMASSTLVAAPATPLSEADMAKVEQDASSIAQAANEANQTTEQSAAAAKTAADQASAKAEKFLSDAPIKPSPSAEPAFAAASQALNVKPTANDTKIECDGGVYFDAEAGVLVYQKNVRVDDPRFSLTGANELKVIFKNTEKSATPDASPSFAGKLGSVDKIIASGAVRILQKNPEAGKQAIEASGALFHYNLTNGEIILSGGFPWVRQGNSVMRAKEPNLKVRILSSGSFTTQGNWEMRGILPQK